MRVRRNGVAEPVRDAVYSQRLAYTGTDLEYLGYAQAGSATSAPVWQIRRYTYVVGVLTAVGFAGGSDTFVNVWDDRATLNYS